MPTGRVRGKNKIKSRQRCSVLAERVVFNDNGCELQCILRAATGGKSPGPGERLLHLRGLNDVFWRGRIFKRRLYYTTSSYLF